MSSEPQVSPPEPTPPGPPVPPPPPAPAKTQVGPLDEVKLTKAGALWMSLIAGFLILIAFFGWRWTLPLGVAILLAAVCGGLLTVFVGAARIFQLRRAAKKNLKAALKG